MPEPKYEIGVTRPDEFDEIMAMTRRAAVFNEEEVETVTELLEGYEEGPEVSGYYFLSCRVASHLDRSREAAESKDALRQARCYSAGAALRTKLNVVPTSTWLCTSTVPPCASTICLTMLRPRPVPVA